MGMANTRMRTCIGFQERLGTNVIINGDFSTDSDWDKGDGWTIDGVTAGKANCDGSQGAATVFSQVNAAISGGRFRLTFTLSGYAFGTVTPYMGGSGAMTARSSDDTFVEDKLSSGSARLSFIGNSAFSCDLDDVSVEEIFLS